MKCIKNYADFLLLKFVVFVSLFYIVSLLFMCLNVWLLFTVELHLSGRWLSGSAWPFG
jgi:hypothetical protein